MPKTDIDYKHNYIHYSTSMPTVLRTSVVYGDTQKTILCLDTEYTMYSQQADYLANQLVLKAGIEKKYSSRLLDAVSYIMRGGIIFCPSIFDGYLSVPNFFQPGVDQIDAVNLASIPKYEKLSKSDMTYLTIGTSLKLNNDAELNLSFATDIKPNVNVQQFNSSIKFDLKVFNNLKNKKK
jgi:hypothetical protein